jgi:beta-lactamase class A
MRRILGLQVWPHRLAAGFPDQAVRVSGKTGTLLTLRGEAGVVEPPGAPAVAVAVVVRTATSSSTLPQADAAIGTAARIAVDALAAG